MAKNSVGYLKEALHNLLPPFLRRYYANLRQKYPLLFITIDSIFFYGFLFIPLTPSWGLATDLRYKLFCHPKGISALDETLHRKVYEEFAKMHEGDIVLDLGTYVGGFTIRASECIGKRGLVVAVEPEPNNLKLLRKNVSKCSNVIIVPAAVGGTKGYKQLYYAPKEIGHSLVINPGLGGVEVEVTTIDDIVRELDLPKVDFIKMDVEGNELEAFKGAQQTLSMHGVKLVIEVGHYHGQCDEIVNYLLSKGIKVLGVKDEFYIYAET